MLFRSLWVTHALLARSGSPESDAIVPTDSGRWGEYLGTWEGDHYSETGPIPFGGKLIDLEVFERVAGTLSRELGN